MQISVFDLTTNTRGRLPIIPDAFSIEQPVNRQDTPILASYPNIQITARGPRTWTVTLDLYGPQGEQCWKDLIYPAFGLENDRPHTLQMAWGATTDETFTGKPIGLPATKHEFGGATVFSRVLDFVLVEFRNQAPKTVVVATGAVQSRTGIHTVRAGETLSSIAKLYGTSAAMLAQLNGGNPPFKPNPGTKLVVPKK